MGSVDLDTVLIIGKVATVIVRALIEIIGIVR